MKKLFTTSVAAWLLLGACIKKIDVPLRNADGQLVVEGWITNDPGPYRIRLSYSGSYISAAAIPDASVEKQAALSITDDLGNTVSLAHADSGFYQTTNPAFRGTPGRAYTLRITLPDGRKFRSTAERMEPVPPVDKVSRIALDDRSSLDRPALLKVFIDARDPAGSANYYRWVSYSWSPRLATGVVCGFSCIRGRFCHQLFESGPVYTFSDAGIDGNFIRGKEVFEAPVYHFGRHYINIGQQSLSREAYQFWQRYLDQREKTGSILDPLPSPIEGNVVNEDNPDDLALGYFGASAVRHFRFVLVPTFITPVFLDQTASFFIGTGECNLIYRNALVTPPFPSGWETAPEIFYP